LIVNVPIDIILLSYNRLDYLERMVDSLEQRTRAPYRLTIVDNVSGARTRQWLRDNAERFHQVIWNERNEHLAAFDRAIKATQSDPFVISDADLVVSEPTPEGCWLARLLALAERHADFGLIGVRLDSVSAARNARLEAAPLIDGELLETPTGVWLNLIRREALRVPYMSDGITCHALRRAGYRVGIAANIYATHLGDEDPHRHPDYLARKQEASGWRTTYPDYPELEQAAAPPTLEAIALAAPLLAALGSAGVEPAETADIGGELAAVDRHVWTLPAEASGVLARAVVAVSPDPQALARAFAHSGELVVVLAPAAPPPQAPAGWQLIREEPGPQPVMLDLARLAGRPRWRRRLLYSTTEYAPEWLAVFADAAFGDEGSLRVYAFRSDRPRPIEAAPAPGGAAPKRLNPPLAPRRRRVGPLVTKLRRLLRAEWALFRSRGR
jgi:hypothetical protein